MRTIDHLEEEQLDLDRKRILHEDGRGPRTRTGGRVDGRGHRYWNPREIGLATRVEAVVLESRGYVVVESNALVGPGAVRRVDVTETIIEAVMTRRGWSNDD